MVSKECGPPGLDRLPATHSSKSFRALYKDNMPSHPIVNSDAIGDDVTQETDLHQESQRHESQVEQGNLTNAARINQSSQPR